MKEWRAKDCEAYRRFRRRNRARKLRGIDTPVRVTERNRIDIKINYLNRGDI